METSFSFLADVFARAGIDYAVIGAHAVNVWVEPRATADLDVTVCANAEQQRVLRQIFEAAGYAVTREHGGALPSGPDFVRFVAAESALTIEVQSAKTDLQREVVARAITTASGLRVATPEDLIVMKLVAYRSKDRIDLLALMRLENLDWQHVERWAREWQVLERLDEMRVEAVRS